MAAALCRLAALLLGIFLSFSQPALACDSSDKAALINIQAAFDKPNKLSSWNLSSSCCTWYGINCGEKDTSQRVVNLIFENNDGPNNSLSGSLPDALGDLPFLLIIQFNNHTELRGSLPLALTRLRHLSVLRLPFNSLSGNIPFLLSQIPTLSVLDLSFNKFSGLIPPELSELPILKALYLESNGLKGCIPAAFGNFNKLSPPYLNLSKNKLSGDIPTELGVPDWDTLDLSQNNLSGDASVFFNANKTLESIHLSFNEFDFDMSHVIFPISLLDLDMRSNRITGSIPAQINQLINLIKFDVSHNQLCGDIPAGPVMDKFDDSHFSGNKCLCRSKYSCLKD